MSLLEDVFLNDEAGEAQELERVVEGDEFDDRPRSPLNSDENSEKEDEAVEDKRRVDPNAKAKRVVKNPRFTLNPARLTGPRGIQVIPEHFKDFKFKGKGHEKEDLDMVLKKLEHWAYRLYPKFQFQDCLKKIETLGKKRPVMVHLHKIRSDQYISEETVVQKDSSDDEATPAPIPEEDEFDKLLQQQIDLARATPAPGSVKKPGLSTPIVEKRSPLTMPKATSSPSISEEQKERMIKNRKLAEERRLARLKQNTGAVDKINSIEEEPIVINDNVEVRPNIIINEINVSLGNESSEEDANVSDTNLDTVKVKKVNRSNVIDSGEDSDEDNAKNLVIDMTDEPKMSPKKPNSRKNKSNIIDSDDNESDIDSNLVVDISGALNIRTELETEKSNTTDFNNASNDINTVKKTLIDLTEQNTKEVKRNEQIYDSSSEDEDMNVIETISVDIHANSNTNNCKNDDTEIKEAGTNINADNDLIGAEDISGNEIEIGDMHDIKNVSTNIKEKDNKNSAKDINSQFDEEIGNKTDATSTILDEKENIDSNVLQNDETVGIMDVDFSDDF